MLSGPFCFQEGASKMESVPTLGKQKMDLIAKQTEF